MSQDAAAAAERGEITDLRQAMALRRMLLFILGDVRGARRRVAGRTHPVWWPVATR